MHSRDDVLQLLRNAAVSPDWNLYLGKQGERQVLCGDNPAFPGLHDIGYIAFWTCLPKATVRPIHAFTHLNVSLEDSMALTAAAYELPGHDSQLRTRILRACGL